jgi:sulfonate transport system substrate-binding protein
MSWRLRAAATCSIAAGAFSDETEETMTSKRCLVSVVVAFMVCLGAWSAPSPAHAEDKPRVIRVANPGVGIGGRPVVAYGAWSLVHIQGLLEKEFKPDGIEVEWTFARGAGPAVNELFSNDLADITLLGDLPSIIGRAGGLKTRLLAAAGLNNLYLAVPADSSARKIEDLTGKKVAVFKGTCVHLAANRILQAHGLGEKDVRAINMDQVTTLSALTTGDVDAALAGPELLSLQDRGAARIIYSTKGDPRFTCNSSIVASDDFVRKYPSIVRRILRVYVQTAAWVTRSEAEPNEIYQLFTRSGIPYSSFKSDWGGEQFLVKVSPKVDDYLRNRYRSSIEDAYKFHLIRKPFDFDSWVDSSFLDQVLQEQQLAGLWPARPPL